MTRRIATISLAAVVAAACDGRTGDSAASGGLLVIQPADVHLFGSSESIADVNDLEVHSDGTVWVLNSVEPFFVGFDSEGRVVQSHGKGGGGPEEFQAPSGFVSGGIGGEVWVFDQQRHALIEVSRADAARSEIPLPRDRIPVGSLSGGMHALSNLVRTARLGDEVILARRSDQPDSDFVSYWLGAWSAELVALDPATGETRDGIEVRTIPFPPPRYAQVTPEQFARVTFELAVVEQLGEVSGRLPEVTAADSARLLDGVVRRLSATPDQLAQLLPRFVDFRCDGSGTQWIHPLDVEVGGLKGGPTWLRITAEGDVQEVRLPDRFDPYRFTPDRIWGIQRDEFDVASVAWIQLP